MVIVMVIVQDDGDSGGWGQQGWKERTFHWCDNTPPNMFLVFLYCTCNVWYCLLKTTGTKIRILIRLRFSLSENYPDNLIKLTYLPHNITTRSSNPFKGRNIHKTLSSVFSVYFRLWMDYSLLVVACYVGDMLMSCIPLSH